MAKGKKLPYMAANYLLIFISKYILWPRSIIFLLCLLFDLVIRALIFASTSNLQSGPRFAEIWSTAVLEPFSNVSFLLSVTDGNNYCPETRTDKIFILAIDYGMFSLFYQFLSPPDLIIPNQEPKCIKMHKKGTLMPSMPRKVQNWYPMQKPLASTWFFLGELVGFFQKGRPRRHRG